MSEEKPEATSAAVSGEEVVKKSKKRRQHGRQDSYASYIYKMLKTLNKDIGLSKKSMNVLVSLVDDMFNRIFEEACRMAQTNQRVTLTSREIIAASRSVLPGELADHARAEALRACKRYNDSLQGIAPGKKVSSAGGKAKAAAK